MIERVGVVGCGLMGSGIAEVCARAGVDVVVFDVSESAVAAGRSRIERSLDRAVQRGKLVEDDRRSFSANLTMTTSLSDLHDRQLVIEAAVEDEALKTELFSQLDKVVERPDAVLASNTSSIPIMKLATVTSRPGQVLGLHFFNPVPVSEPGRAGHVHRQLGRGSRRGPARSPPTSWARR